MLNSLVSIIFSTYNENNSFLKKSLYSVLNQDYKNIEIILVVEPDDINLDYLKNLSESNSKIKIHQNVIKLGFVKSLNYAISLSKGNFIARMDSDDYWLPIKLSKQIKFIVEYNFDLIGCDIELFDQNDNFLGNRIYSKNSLKKNFLFQSGLCHPSVVFKKKLIDKFGNYNTTFVYCEDLELWLRFLSSKVKMSYCPEILMKYRVGKNIIRNHNHWKYNLKSRIMHSYKVYNLFKASFSIIMILILFCFSYLNLDYLPKFFYNKFIVKNE